MSEILSTTPETNTDSTSSNEPNPLEPNNAYAKLALVRKVIAELIQSGEIKKTGLSQFNYLELVDFLPYALPTMEEVGLLAVFELGAQQAYLHIHDVDDPYDPITFSTPVIKATLAGKMPDPLKELGATQTYLRRYLWIQALELAVPDNVDAQLNHHQNQTVTLDKIEL